MKTLLLTFSLILGMGMFPGHAEDTAAQESGSTRSEQQFSMLWERSPFVLSSVEPVSDLARRYSIAGVAFIGDRQNVFIRDNTNQRRYHLSEKENDHGMRLMRLIENTDPLKVRAVVRIENQEATLTYDATALAAVASWTPTPSPTPESPSASERRGRRGYRNFRSGDSAGYANPHTPPVISREAVSPATGTQPRHE